jgi:hypothetical protein
MTKKITVEKNEGVAEVIDRVLEQSENEVVVTVPKGSVLLKSTRNFALLAREAEAQGKSVFIESTDPAIMAFARAAGLEKTASYGPVTGGVSDIVFTRRTAETGDTPTVPAPAANRHRRTSEVKRKLEIVSDDVVSDEEVRRKLSIVSDEDEKGAGREKYSDKDENDDEENSETSDGFFTNRQDHRFFKNRTLQDSEDDDDEESQGSGTFWKWVGGIVVVVIVIIGAWGVTALFGHVTLAINFTQTPWQYQGTFTADKSVSVPTIGAANSIIPAQVFSISKNTTQLFSASSEQNVSVKATGVLTIYNAYSSAPQTLVATTRFVTPDGKIFRLTDSVVVPGAEITNGQIVPSSINAQIVADAAGPDYNVGPVAKLTVPGFANTPKSAGFYGAIASSTTGGFIGQKAVPTADDIAAAKVKMTSLLQSDLQSSLAGTYPNNFVILSGASTTQVTKLTVNTTTDQNGKFSVFGEAALSAIGFDQTAFKALLLTLAQTTEPSSTFSSLTLQYSNVTPDFTNGTVSFAVSAQGSLEPAFASSTFETTIAGKSITDARTAVAALPQLANGSISVWPAWLWTIPSDPKKIDVKVN